MTKKAYDKMAEGLQDAIAMVRAQNHPLREAVARALWNAHGMGHLVGFNTLSDGAQSLFYRQADAAIAATLAGIREPSERMVEDGTSIIRFGGAVGRSEVEILTDAWQTMIDALAQEVAGTNFEKVSGVG